MEPFFFVLHVVLAVALIGIVLIQRSSTDGFGLGSGSGSNFMSGRQAANLLTRATAILATLFILNSLWLGWLATHKDRTSMVDRIEAAASKEEKPAKDAVDKAGDAKPEADEIKSDKADAKEDADKKPAAAEDKSEDKKASEPEEAPAVPVAQ